MIKLDIPPRLCVQGIPMNAPNKYGCQPYNQTDAWLVFLSTIEEWVDEQCRSSVSLRLVQHDEDDWQIIVAFFEDDIEAVHFKMRWF